MGGMDDAVRDLSRRRRGEGGGRRKEPNVEKRTKKKRKKHDPHLNASFNLFRVTPLPTLTNASSPTSPMDWKLHMSMLMPPRLLIRTLL